LNHRPPGSQPDGQIDEKVLNIRLDLHKGPINNCDYQDNALEIGVNCELGRKSTIYVEW
jgi:hypothetical protein